VDVATEFAAMLCSSQWLKRIHGTREHQLPTGVAFVDLLRRFTRVHGICVVDSMSPRGWALYRRSWQFCSWNSWAMLGPRLTFFVPPIKLLSYIDDGLLNGRGGMSGFHVESLSS
jgi:hypothetical protein